MIIFHTTNLRRGAQKKYVMQMHDAHLRQECWSILECLGDNGFALTETERRLRGLLLFQVKMPGRSYMAFDGSVYPFAAESIQQKLSKHFPVKNQKILNFSGQE